MVGGGNSVVGVGGGGGDISGATQAWVSQNFVSIEFFSKLFKAYDSAATPNEIKPNDMQSTITNIKAMFGFWTQQYISALGQNSGGGGGGTDLNEPLASINVAELGAPTEAGQVLTWNGTQWVYNIPGGGGGGGTGTVTSITAGTGLSGGTITTMGTISINSTYQSYIQHGETAYGWGNHASAGYATQTWVGQQGFALASNVYSKEDADAKFMTIAAFENLFNAIASDGSTKVNHPYTANVASIKAMFGLWTNQYLSALGLNSSGGGGGASTLAGLNYVQLDTLSNGQVLKYDGNLGKWVNGTAGTVTSVGMTVPTGFLVDPTAITSSGTFAITYTSGYSLPLTADVSKGVTAYGWGDHAQAGYSTPNSVASQMQTYAKIQNGTITIGDNSITPLTQHQTVEGTFWGQSWNNGGTVNGNMTGVGTIKMTGHLYMHEGGTGIYLNSDGTGIDWHDTSDSYVASLLAFTSSMVTAHQGLTIPVNKSLRIGDGMLTWDAANNAFKVEKYDGTAANFYATGGISALGVSTGGSVTNLTVSNDLTLGGELTFGTNDASIYMDDYFYIESGSTVSINGVECYSGNVWLNRLYLDTTRYLYVSGGTLYYYNGSESKQIAFIN